MEETKEKMMSKRKLYKEKRDAEIRKRIKNNRFEMRLTAEDKVKLKELAERYEMDLTTYVLAASFFNCLVFVNYEEVRELSFQIGKLGNNINQIARVVNEAALKDSVNNELLANVKIQLDQLDYLENELIETNKKFYRATKKIVTEIKENFQEDV